GEGAAERDDSSHDPCGEDERSRGEPHGDKMRVDEDAGPDDAADDDHRRVERAERAAEPHGGRELIPGAAESKERANDRVDVDTRGHRGSTVHLHLLRSPPLPRSLLFSET